MVNIRLESEIREKLEEIAAKENRTLTGLVRHAILTYISSVEIKKPKK